MGWQLLLGKNPEKARQVFTLYLRDYSSGKWAEAAKSKLIEIDEMKNKKG